jgi:hypothetical protein
MRRYDPRYYTLDRLTEESLFIIRSGLEQVRKDYDVSYPVDCFALLEQIRSSGKISLEIEVNDGFSNGFDAAAMYFGKYNNYLIVLKPVPACWKTRSSWRRRNFTVAHELGHIFCKHLLISDQLKSDEQKSREDLEADEFAARLLMPENLILKSQFRSGAELAEHFLVSEQACFKRLNNLKRLDLYRAPARAVCPACGNDRISPAADYCVICGCPLYDEGREGVRVVEYPCAIADGNHRVVICPSCGHNVSKETADCCSACGTPVFNFCANEKSFWPCDHINPPNARFCEFCGGPTVYAARNLLPDWQEEQKAYIAALVSP